MGAKTYELFLRAYADEEPVNLPGIEMGVDFSQQMDDEEGCNQLDEMLANSMRETSVRDWKFVYKSRTPSPASSTGNLLQSTGISAAASRTSSAPKPSLTAQANLALAGLRTRPPGV